MALRVSLGTNTSCQVRFSSNLCLTIENIPAHICSNATGPQANLQLRRLIVERQAAPDILLSGLVTPEDVTALFEMCVFTSLRCVQICTKMAHSDIDCLPRIYAKLATTNGST